METRKRNSPIGGNKVGGQVKPITRKPMVHKPGTSGTAMRPGKNSEDRYLEIGRRVADSLKHFAARPDECAPEIDAAVGAAPSPARGAAAAAAVSSGGVPDDCKSESLIDGNAAPSEAAPQTHNVGGGAEAVDKEEVTVPVAAVEQPTADKPITSSSDGIATEPRPVSPPDVPEADGAENAVDDATTLASPPLVNTHDVAAGAMATSNEEVLSATVTEMPDTDEPTVPASETAHGKAVHPATSESDVNLLLLNFPGEIHKRGITTVDAFATKISTAWHRTVEATLEAAHSCAMANFYLTTDQKRELIAQLPFGPETFSKLVKIGNDPRLQGAEIKQLLPPHYTTIYLITDLDEGELKLAVDSNIINPEMKRGKFERWRNKRREQPQQGPAVRPEVRSDAGTSGAPILNALVPDQIDPDGQREPPLDPGTAETQSSPGFPDHGPMHTTTDEVPSPTTAPVDREGSPADASHRLSADEQRKFDIMMDAFNCVSMSLQEQFLMAAYEAVPEVVQQRLKATLLRLDVTSTTAAAA